MESYVSSAMSILFALIVLFMGTLGFFLSGQRLDSRRDIAATTRRWDRHRRWAGSATSTSRPTGRPW